MASNKSIIANVALRVNPNIDAHTHHYITTGLEENKFGIALEISLMMQSRYASGSRIYVCAGFIFPIGSQITYMGHIEYFVSASRNS